MGFFGFGKKKEKEQQPAQAEETRLEAQAEETSGTENAQPPADGAEQAAQDEKKQGLFSRLWQGLSKTRGNVAGRVDELIEATETIDEDFYEDLVDILIMSDMGVRTSDKVIQELKTRVARERITDAKKAREILKKILKEIMGMPRKPLKWPMVMLVVGVNGVGKTTTIGKLAMRFKDARHSVVLAAADTIWMWMAGYCRWNRSRYGSRNWLVTVSLAPMVRCPICSSRLWDSFSSPVSSRPMALRTYSYSIRPSGVRATPRELRANRRVCSSPSSCLMDWLTADWEIYRA